MESKTPFYEYEGDGIYHVGKHGLHLDDYHTLEKEMKAELDGGEDYESDWIARYEAPEGSIVKITKLEVDWGFIDCYQVEVLSIGPEDICFQSTIVEDKETYYGHDHMVFGSGNIKHEKHLNLTVLELTEKEWEERYIQEGPNKDDPADNWDELWDSVCQADVFIVEGRILKNIYQKETGIELGEASQKDIETLKNTKKDPNKNIECFIDTDNCDGSMEIKGGMEIIEFMIDKLNRPGYLYSIPFTTDLPVNHVDNLELVRKIEIKQAELLELYKEAQSRINESSKSLYEIFKSRK